MAGQIRISPEALHAAANEYRELNAVVEEISQDLSALHTLLNEAWDGGASNNALITLTGIKTTTDQFAESLLISSQKLDGIASAFENVDNGVSIIAPWGQIVMPFLKGCPKPDFLLRLDEQLRIIPDQVRNVASKCLDVSDKYILVQNKIVAIREDLHSTWEGNSYNHFAEKSTEIVADIEYAVDNIREFAMKIRSAADRYEELDNML